MFSPAIVPFHPGPPVEKVVSPTTIAARDAVIQNAYNILTSSLRINDTQRFWWESSGQTLSNMFQRLGYDMRTQLIHMLFFHVHVLPHMGPRPDHENKPVFKSYMTDDHTPIEYSWLFNRDGTTTVRYVIEPIDECASSSAYQMIEELRPVLQGLDLTWFNKLDKVLIWHGDMDTAVFKHRSQYFLGFDCTRSGMIKLKAYFMPEIMSVQTGVSKEELVLRALKELDAGLTTPWEVVMAYLETLPESIRPTIEIVSSDCTNPEESRVKIYVRTRSTTFSHLEGMMTLGGRLGSPVIEDAIAALEDIWNLVAGVDTTIPGWKDRSLPPRVSAEANDEHLTGGLIFFYELCSGQVLPFPKTYLPVRHYCPDDLAIARGMVAYHRKRGSTLFDGYVDQIGSIFATHRALGDRAGIHTYVSVAVKARDIEVTTYLNEETYAPERFQIL